MPRKLLWTLVGILIALPIGGALVGTKILQFQAMADAGAQFVMPPEPVNVIKITESQWRPVITSVGSVMALQGTVVSTEADGVLRTVDFEPGAAVDAGQTLAQLDVDVEQAQLHAAEVAANWARVALRRARELSSSRNISQAELDSATNAVNQADAQVSYIKALITKKTVRAPFAGRLGIRSISVGQYLPKGSPVVSLQSLDPVYVEFSVPQQKLGELSTGLGVAVAADSYPGHAFDGQITAISPEIDPATRNVRVQATLPNPEGRLRPGMFVSLEVTLARTEPRLLVPATAIQHGPHGDSVFLVEEATNDSDNTRSLVLRQQFVRLGARHGDFVVVDEGVKAGETAVTTGVFKLRPGMAVEIDNSLAPEFSLAPKPRNS